jgi:hypothetical protein
MEESKKIKLIDSMNECFCILMETKDCINKCKKRKIDEIDEIDESIEENSKKIKKNKRKLRLIKGELNYDVENIKLQIKLSRYENKPVDNLIKQLSDNIKYIHEIETSLKLY